MNNILWAFVLFYVVAAYTIKNRECKIILMWTEKDFS